jgi:hypothetical protein
VFQNKLEVLAREGDPLALEILLWKVLMCNMPATLLALAPAMFQITIWDKG